MLEDEEEIEDEKEFLNLEALEHEMITDDMDRIQTDVEEEEEELKDEEKEEEVKEDDEPQTDKQENQRFGLSLEALKLVQEAVNESIAKNNSKLEKATIDKKAEKAKQVKAQVQKKEVSEEESESDLEKGKINKPIGKKPEKTKHKAPVQKKKEVNDEESESKLEKAKLKEKKPEKAKPVQKKEEESDEEIESVRRSARTRRAVKFEEDENLRKKSGKETKNDTELPKAQISKKNQGKTNADIKRNPTPAEINQPLDNLRKSKRTSKESNLSRPEDEFVKKPKTEEKQVERIMGHRYLGGAIQYQVKWLGLPFSNNSWVLSTQLPSYAGKLVEKYRASQKL